MTKLDLINLALARIGEAPIQALDEGSATANAAARFYDLSRRAALRDYNWNFAFKRETLPLAETGGGQKVYAAPSDCLRVVSVRSRGGSSAPERLCAPGRTPLCECGERGAGVLSGH